MIVFTSVERKITNLNTGNVYGNGSGMTPIADSVNVIGEKKRLEYSYTSDVSIAGYNFFINLALFMPIGAINPLVGKGNIYFECAMPSAITGASTRVCNLNSSSALYNLEQYRNYEVSVIITDATTFSIRVDFYQSFDLLGYMRNSMSMENSMRFLKDRYNNPTPEVVTGASIYNGATHDGRLYLYAELATDKTDNGYIENTFDSYTAKFVGDSPATISITDLKYFNTGSVPQEIAAPGLNTDTKVLLSFHCADYVPTVYVLMFKINKADNTVNFIENYQAETAFIDPSQGDQDILTSPFEAPAALYWSTDDYECSFTLDKTGLELGDELGFIVMIYDSADLADVSAFLAKSSPVQEDAPYTGAGFTATGLLDDYNTEFTGNDLECVVEERMRSRLKLVFPADQYKDDIFNRLGLVIPNDITTFLKKVEFKIFEDALTPFVPGLPPQSVQNYFVEAEANKVYGFPGLYFLGGSLNVGFDFATADQLTLSANWRNRYEANIPCIRSLINGVDYNSPQATQYWGGKTLSVQWKLTFEYNTLAVPFVDEYIFTQQIRVKGYEGSVEIHAQELDFDELENWCSNEKMCLFANFTAGAPDDTYKLINNIEQNPGSILTIAEAEDWVGGQLPQLTIPKIYAQAEPYTTQTIDGEDYDKAAKFCVDQTLLSIGVDYKISAIAKKV